MQVRRYICIKNLLLIQFLILVCGLSFGNTASALDLTTEEQDWLAAHPVIDITTENGAPPYQFIALDGQLQGIISDYSKALESRLGVKVNLTSYHINEAVDELKLGKPLVYGFLPFEGLETNPQYQMSHSALAAYLSLFGKKTQSEIRDPKEVAGKIIAVKKSYESFAIRKLEENGNKLLWVENSMEGIASILEGQADYYFEYAEIARFYLRSTQQTGIGEIYSWPRPQIAGFVVRNDAPLLLSILNKAIVDIERNELNSILSKWHGRKIESRISFTQQERALLNKHPVLRLGYDNDWAPVEFSENGQFKGISAGYFERLEQILGIEIQPIELKNWQTAMSAMELGELDLLSTVTHTPQRNKFISSTQPYLNFPTVIVTNQHISYINDMNQLDGKRVAVVTEFASQELLEKNYPGFQLQLVNNPKEGLLSVIRGESDAYIGNLAVIGQIIGKEGLTGIKVSGEVPLSGGLSIGVRNEIAELVPILQKALDAISHEERNAIAAKWLSVTFKHEVDHATLWRIVFGFVVLLIIAFLWIYFVHTQKQKLELTEQKLNRYVRRLAEAQRLGGIGDWRWDLATNRLIWSDNLYRIYGMEPGAILPNYKEILALHKIGDAKTLDVAREALKNGTSFELELQLLRSVGDETIILTKGEAKRNKKGDIDHLIGTVQDITEKWRSRNKLQKAMEQAEYAARELQISESRIELAHSAAEIALWEFNPQTYEVKMTDMIAIMLGYEADELFEISKEKYKKFKNGFQKVFEQLLHPDHKDSYKKDLVEFIEVTGVYDVEYRVLRADGQWTWMRLYGKVMWWDDSKKPLTAYGFVTNIDKMKDLQSEAWKAKESAEAANNTKGVFLAGMSHELRTPLNAILGYAQLLLNDQDLTGKQQKSLDTIQKSGRNLDALLSDILEFTRLEESKIELQPENLSVNSFIEDLINVVKSRTKPQVSIDFEIGLSTPVSVIADTKRLRQILLNLLNNAIKYTLKGHVILLVSEQFIDNLDKNNICLRFAVEDSGQGIASEDLGRIFQSFVQLRRGRSKNEGAGLGLAISQHLVTLMHGQLKVKSELGKGSQFWFDITVPIISGNNLIEKPNTLIPQGYRGKQKTILIVDDNQINQDVLKELLENLGFKIILANNGAEALAFATFHDADAVLMDLLMPVMNGFEAKTAMRELPSFAEIPIVAISANIEKEQDSIDSGFDGFIAKPFMQEKLFEVLGKHLKIEWIFETNTNLTEEIVFPPSEILIQLAKLVSLGMLPKIAEWADAYHAQAPEYQEFTRRVMLFAENFDDEGLLALLNSARKQKM